MASPCLLSRKTECRNKNYSARKHVSGRLEVFMAVELEFVYRLQSQLHFKYVCAHVFLAFPSLSDLLDFTEVELQQFEYPSC